jgi:hypothetical protein
MAGPEPFLCLACEAYATVRQEDDRHRDLSAPSAAGGSQASTCDPRRSVVPRRGRRSPNAGMCRAGVVRARVPRSSARVVRLARVVRRGRIHRGRRLRPSRRSPCGCTGPRALRTEPGIHGPRILVWHGSSWGSGGAACSIRRSGPRSPSRCACSHSLTAAVVVSRTTSSRQTGCGSRRRAMVSSPFHGGPLAQGRPRNTGPPECPRGDLNPHALYGH